MPPRAGTYSIARSSTRFGGCRGRAADPADRRDHAADQGPCPCIVVHRGDPTDLGNPGGYLKAAVDFASHRDDHGPDLQAVVGGTAGAGRLRHVHGPAMEKGVLCVRFEQQRVTAAAVAPRPVRVAIAEAQGLMSRRKWSPARYPVSTRLPSTVTPCAASTCSGRPIGGDEPSARTGRRGRRSTGQPAGDGSDRGGRAQAHRPTTTATAARVPTSAPMPTLADAVLYRCGRTSGRSGCGCCGRCARRAYVRRTGDDVQPGDVAVRRHASARRRSVCSLPSAGTGTLGVALGVVRRR